MKRVAKTQQIFDIPPEIAPFSEKTRFSSDLP